MTTNEALNKIASDEGFNDWTHLMIYEEGCTANITDYVKKAMQLYAATIRDKDRIIVAENTNIIDSNNEIYSSVYHTGNYGASIKNTFIVNKDSILKAPKQELK